MQIFGFLGGLLGYVLWAAFWLLKNFGLAIIVFTILIKILLFPFSVKQQKSMAGSARLQKKQKELKEKYANNQQKYQEELSKLYEKEGVKMGGGCLNTIIPLLVIFGIFYAVAYPLTNTLHLDSNKINEALVYVNQIPGYASSANPTYQEISFLKIFPNIQNTEAIQSIFNNSEISTINTFYNGFNTFGIDLLAVPSDYGIFSWYTLFPVFCFLSNVVTQLITTKINSSMMQQQGCMRVMMLVLPLFSAYIAYTVPAAVAFYWIISSLIQLVQSILLGKVFSAGKLTANSEARHAALLFANEAKVEYVYAPKNRGKADDTTKPEKNAKSKKK